MNQSQTNMNLLTAFNSKHTVFYVESSYQPEINNFIQANYTQIVELYSAGNLNFCYLPSLLQNAAYTETLNYNRPYLPASLQELDVQQIYNRLISKQDVEIAKGGILFSGNFGFSKRIAAANIEADQINLQVFESFVQRTIDFIQKIESSLPRFQIISNESRSDDEYDNNEYSLDANEPYRSYDSIPMFKIS